MGRIASQAELPEMEVERRGEHVSLFMDGERVTNVTILERSRRLQRAFAGLGLGRGDVACLCMLNHPYVNSVFGGIFRTGATAVPVMAQLTPPELRYIFSHTEARAVVTDAMMLDKIREAIAGLDHIEWIAVRGGTTDESRTPREYALEELLESDEETSLPAIDVDEDVAVMLYTSGTTGKPKGVMLTHANLHGQGEASIDARELHNRTHPMISTAAMPMAHIFGVGIMNIGNMLPKEYEPGFHVSQVWFDPLKTMEAIDEHKCTDYAAVPTMLALMLSHPQLGEFDLTSLENNSVGAAPLPVEIANAWAARTKSRVCQIYGMTENAGIATADRFGRPYREGTAGLPYCNVKLRIADDAVNELPPGEAGEILTQGPTVMKGYFKDPDATANTVRGGWLHTGDVGYLDDDGYLYVVDRKKDMIIKGGENIFPAEVESAIYAFDGIAEVAVIGVPHDTYGEDVVAFVVPRGNAHPDEQAIIDFVKQRLTPFKAPSRVILTGDIPKSGVGKILRRELRSRMQEGAEA